MLRDKAKGEAAMVASRLANQGQAELASLGAELDRAQAALEAELEAKRRSLGVLAGDAAASRVRDQASRGRGVSGVRGRVDGDATDAGEEDVDVDAGGGGGGGGGSGAGASREAELEAALARDERSLAEAVARRERLRQAREDAEAAHAAGLAQLEAARARDEAAARARSEELRRLASEARRRRAAAEDAAAVLAERRRRARQGLAEALAAELRAVEGRVGRVLARKEDAVGELAGRLEAASSLGDKRAAALERLRVATITAA